MALQVGELFAVLTADDKNFKKVLEGAEKKFTDISKNIGNVGKTLSMKVTAPLAGAAGTALKLAGDFEESSNKVATIMDTNVVSLEKMQQGAIDLSDSLGISANEINESLYQVMSANGDTANSLKYVAIAGKAAKGGFTTTETAVDGLTSVMNAYKMSGSDAMQHVSDLMLTTQNLGKTTFGDLANSLYNVIPTASATGVSFEEISAQMALITSQGTPTSVATTQLRQMLVELSKEGGKASDTFKELAGEGFKQFIDKGGTVQEALLMLEQHAKDSDLGVNDLFSSVEAGAAVLQLTGENTEKYSQFLTNMSDVAGATEKAFDTMNQGTNDSISDTLNMMKNLGIEIGTMLAPYLQAFIEILKDGVTWFRNLDDGTKKTIMTVAGIVAVIGPVLMIVGSLFGAVSKIVGGFKLLAGAAGILTKAIPLLTGPFGLVVAGIAAAIAIGVLLYKNWDEIMAWAGKLKDTVVEKFNLIKDGVTTAIETARDTVKLAIDKIKGFFNFEWSLPKLKMPKFSIKGKFSLMPPSIPKIGVDWYKEGGIFNKPSIIGVGEAGTEAVLPISRLKDLMGSVIDKNSNNSNVVKHTGEITIRGVNNENEFIAAAKYAIGKDISINDRRLPNRAKIIPID